MSTATPPMRTGHGRRMTACDSRNQKPSSRTSVVERRTRNLLTRGPRAASAAGRMSTAATTARPTVAMPAYANERRKNCGNTSRADSEIATVMPE